MAKPAALAWMTLALAAAWIPPAQTADLPADAAVNPAMPTMTVEPRVVVNSGRLEWLPFKRDLSAWPTLSYEDKRPTLKPRKVELTGPIDGDPVRGKELTTRRDKGYCVTCHELPGEKWPGTVGVSLLHFKRHHYDSARLYQQIFDPRVHNPDSAMPPFGTNHILTDRDIRDLVAYLQSIE